MKKILFTFLVSAIGHVYGQSLIDPQKIEGSWIVVWSYYSSTSVLKSEGSAPLAEAVWTFSSNGTYTAISTISETGKYFIKGRTLFVDADNPITPDFDKREYSIVSLDDRKLEIGLEIVRTEDFFMVNYIVFDRK